MDRTTVADVMLPLEDYAVVPPETTILDAVRALDEAQKRVKPGQQVHRAVLVKDASGRIVGKVGHFAFLRGLEPSYGQIGDWDQISRAGLSARFVTTLMEGIGLWRQSFEDLRRIARTRTVGEIMRPVAYQVDAQAPITDAIHMFVVHQTLSLLVKREGEIVGILRLSDVFTTVFRLLRDGRREGETKPE